MQLLSCNSILAADCFETIAHKHMFSPEGQHGFQLPRRGRVQALTVKVETSACGHRELQLTLTCGGIHL